MALAIFASSLTLGLSILLGCWMICQAIDLLDTRLFKIGNELTSQTHALHGIRDNRAWFSKVWYEKQQKLGHFKGTPEVLGSIDRVKSKIQEASSYGDQL